MNKRLIFVIIVGLIVFIVGHRANPTVDKIIPREWVVADSKAYARDVMLAWADNQYACLDRLWTRESNWRPKAYNKQKVMGKHAGGIPQLLGMSTQTPAPRQIDRGFAYILSRYGSPCKAWKFHQRKGWY